MKKNMLLISLLVITLLVGVFLTKANSNGSSQTNDEPFEQVKENQPVDDEPSNEVQDDEIQSFTGSTADFNDMDFSYDDKCLHYRYPDENVKYNKEASSFNSTGEKFEFDFKNDGNCSGPYLVTEGAYDSPYFIYPGMEYFVKLINDDDQVVVKINGKEIDLSVPYYLERDSVNTFEVSGGDVLVFSALTNQEMDTNEPV